MNVHCSKCHWPISSGNNGLVLQLLKDLRGFVRRVELWQVGFLHGFLSLLLWRWFQKKLFGGAVQHRCPPIHLLDLQNVFKTTLCNSQCSNMLLTNILNMYMCMYTICLSTAKDFIRKMMEKNPTKRYLTEQALSHPWWVSVFWPSVKPPPHTSALLQWLKDIMLCLQDCWECSERRRHFSVCVWTDGEKLCQIQMEGEIFLCINSAVTLWGPYMHTET